jgi:D-tyrosyl-tRNA(Tyr) deacylase
MIGLIQRVSSAKVEVGGTCVAQIETGLLVLVAVEKCDTPASAKRLAERVCGYRVFGDSAGRMNLNVIDINGSILLVPQFTLAADTDKGMRPSFHLAADPHMGQQLFKVLVDGVTACGLTPQTGVFGADMQITLINDGPVTFWLKTNPSPSA